MQLNVNVLIFVFIELNNSFVFVGICKMILHHFYSLFYLMSNFQLFIILIDKVKKYKLYMNK